MKKLILSAIFVCAAIVVQAGDTKAEKTKDSSACCAATKSCDQTKAGCCSGKMTAKETSGKQALLSPKAAAELGK
jgi:hypothetical protein